MHTEITHQKLNPITVVTLSIRDFLAAPFRLCLLSLLILLGAIILIWVPLIGVIWFWNSFGVTQKLAPRIVRGETWKEIWGDGFFKTVHDFSLGMPFVAQFLVVGLSACPLAFLGMFLSTGSDGYVATEGWRTQVTPIITPFVVAIWFVVHNRLSILPSMMPSKGMIKLAWKSTQGNFLRMAPITLLKWLLIFGPFLLLVGLDRIASADGGQATLSVAAWVGFAAATILWLAILPYLGLLNLHTHKALLGDPQEVPIATPDLNTTEPPLAEQNVNPNA